MFCGWLLCGWLLCDWLLCGWLLCDWLLCDWLLCDWLLSGAGCLLRGRRGRARAYGRPGDMKGIGA